MQAGEGVDVDVLVERIAGVRREVEELRAAARDDHHRLRVLEGSVKRMLDAQKAARQAESNQYRRLAAAIQMGGLLMAAAMVALTVVTVLSHT